jgi:glutathione S-transferase
MSQRHVLYHSYPFRSSRCAWVIAELGKESEFEVEKVSLHGNPAALEAYGEVHPFRTIPALRLPHGELLLESGAICMYVADLYQSEAAARSLLPREGEAGSYFNVCTPDVFPTPPDTAIGSLVDLSCH